MNTVTVLQGHVLDRLREMPDNSVHCVVTSPPYWGLRDYGCEGQIGLEKTIEEYVAKMVEVFAEVRRVLRKDGVLFLNLGDSYARQGGQANSQTMNNHNDKHREAIQASKGVDGLKPKDLCGIPWTVARALRDPYYTGKIKAERDRVWLAAMIDGEGTICGFTHERKDGCGIRTGVHVNLTNSNMAILDEAFRIWPTSKEQHNAHGNGHYGSMPTKRWIAHGAENKLQLLAELYPYFIAKKTQALLAWNFLNISIAAKHGPRITEPDETKDKRFWIMDALSKLNAQEPVDIPKWIKEPASMYEPGWYLRSDIIWAKPNPMPESVTDRPTRSHEYIFLLTKSAKYFWDQEAVREEQAQGTFDRYKPGEKIPTFNKMGGSTRKNQSFTDATPVAILPNGRNLRSVWTIATAPFAEAHFATFPPALVEKCIKAGTSEKGVCPKCGAPSSCKCSGPDLTIINTPIGNGSSPDPTPLTGRKGMNRPRKEIEGSRPITRYEQQEYAAQLKVSSNQDEMRQEAGTAIDHYTRTDSSGARPIPQELLDQWIDRGWLKKVEVPYSKPLEPVPAVVLDPFSGSGTTCLVAAKLGRDSIGIELKPEYVEMAKKRIKGDLGFLVEVKDWIKERQRQVEVRHG